MAIAARTRSGTIRRAKLPTFFARASSRMRRSCSAGSNSSRRTSAGSQRSTIRPPPAKRSRHGLRVELARALPLARAGLRDAVSALGDRLIPDRHLLVPPLDQARLLETRHHLIEGGRRAAHAVLGQSIPDHPPRRVARANDAKDEELEMSQGRKRKAAAILHKAILGTITLDESAGQKVYWG